jgi:DNA-binding FadR family transcriptional regulator
MTQIKAEARPRSRSALRQDTVVSDIKDYILRGRLSPGDPLPTETELCEAVGASRSSVREAVKTLRALDIVEVRHGHGTFVGRMSLNALVESLAFRGLLNREDDYEVLAELVQVRMLLEQGLATQIIETLTPEHREELADLAQQMCDLAEQGELFIEEDRAFHLLLMEPLGNDLVVQLTGAFWDVHRIVAPTLTGPDSEHLVTAQAHVAIIEAAASADPGRLQQAVADHYAPVLDRIEALRSH